jgi:hypothetical protein
MYPNYGSDVARSRMEARMRDAERARRASQTRAGQTAEHRNTIRKIASTALYLVAWPIKH